MPKIIVPPTPENTYRGEEKFVKKLYATPNTNPSIVWSM